MIHHLGGEQDIRRMGGLRSLMPRTHVAFLVGSLALAGIPTFSGFWSKDGIIAAAFASGGALGAFLYAAGLIGALLTGLYTFRLYFTVFRGEPSELVREHAARGPRRGPAVDAVPVGVLSVLATVGGLRRDPRRVGAVPALDRRDRGAARAPDGRPRTTARARSPSRSRLVGFLVARRAFAAGRQIVGNPGIWRVLEHKLYFDELYDALFYRPAVALSGALRRNVEEPVVERSLDEIGSGTIQVGGEVARVQSGLLRTYAVAIALAVSILVVVFVAVR